MSKLVKKIELLTHDYASKGSKKARNQQRARMLAFGTHCYMLGARTLDEVGARHVIRYWKANRTLSDATLKEHYRAISKLWQLAGKTDTPPAPRLKSTTESAPNAPEALQPQNDPNPTQPLADDEKPPQKPVQMGLWASDAELPSTQTQSPDAKARP